MSRYYKQCGSCVSLNPNDRNGFTYYCGRFRKYRKLEDSPYQSETWLSSSCYEEDYGRDLEALYKMDNPSGACYITTIMCEILRFPDSYKDLETMRKFRDTILQKDLRYLSILMEYDTIGPVIARNLKQDKNAVNIARMFAKNYIAPIVVLIEGNYYNEAISKYVDMVNILKNMYGLKMDNEVVDYDYTRGGHGYVFTKKIGSKVR